MSLPKGFKRLEYIQSSGTQYVDSGFAPKSTSRVVMDVECTESVTSYKAFFGVRNEAMPTATESFNVAVTNATTMRSDYYGTAQSATISSAMARTVIDKNANVTTGYGVTITNTSVSAKESSDTLVLLSLKTEGSGVTNGISAKLYSCQIYDNGLLERDYVPALLDNGEVGLYDRVFHEFYRNAGTGEFIAGPEMVHAGYTELEYIESSGAQFVETDVSIKSTSGFEVDFASVDVSSEKGLIGGFTYGGYNNNFGQYNGQWAAQYGNNQSIFFGTVDTERHTISQNVVQRSSYFDGELLQSELPFYDNTQRTFRLFCYNGGSSYPTFWIGSFRLYYCKIYDNGTEVRIYIPVLHPSGVAGFWDSVNERFYTSATTTDFIAGPEVQTVPKAPANFRVESESDTLVTLAWDASDKAQGYRLYRHGQLLADIMETSVSVSVEPFAGAVFQLTAYNENGEGAGSTLNYYSIPENPLLYLITDRTAQDVTEQTKKGYYAASDLNRVGYAMDYLANIIRGYGYRLDVVTKTDWTDEDWKLSGEMVKYLQSLNNLKSVFSTLVELPETMEKIDYRDANNIEQLLLIIDETIVRVVAGFTRANAFALRSGAKGLPVSQSDRGRNWGQLDAMETTWANWQLATWYLLLYGNLKAEGVVE